MYILTKSKTMFIDLKTRVELIKSSDDVAELLCS